MLRGNLAPDGCVMKPTRLRPALPQACRPGARLRRLSGDEGGGSTTTTSTVTPGSRAGAAERRPAGRPGHAGMGHAADPEEAAEAGRARHGAHFRRAHERHELRRLRAARRAGILRRRAAGAGADRRHHRARRRGAHASTSTCPEDELARRRAAWSRRRRAIERGYGWMFAAAHPARPTRAATSTSCRPASARLPASRRSSDRSDMTCSSAPKPATS